MDEIRSGYLRVSEILSRLRDRTQINQLVLQDKADIGTEVHHNIHMHCLDIPVEHKMYPVRNPMSGQIYREERRGEGYFKSYLKWEDAVKPVYKHQELRLYDDELMITGQVDAVIDGGVDGTYLLDFKCSYKADEDIWKMQAHFYWYLLSMNNLHLSCDPAMCFLQLKKDGLMPEEYHFEFDEDILSQCIMEAQKTWEEKRSAICVA